MFVAAALLAAGCATVTSTPSDTGDPVGAPGVLGSSTTSTDPPQAGAGLPETSLPAAASTTTSSTVPREVTPLQEIMDIGMGEEEYAQLQVAYAQAFEDSIAACLRAEGFDYVAVNMSDPAFGPISDIPPIPEGTEIYGYAFNLRAAIDDPDAAPHGTGFAEVPNPNQALGDAMDETEREEFGRVDAICWNAANESIPDPFNVPISDGGVNLMGWLVEEKRALSDRAKADPAVLEAEEAWSVCMAGSGFPYSAPSSIFVDLDRRFAPLEAAMDAFYESTGRLGLSDEDLATLDELEAYEIQVFTVDRACLEASGHDEVRHEVRVRLEAEFVRKNHDRLALIQGERRAAFDALRELLGL